MPGCRGNATLASQPSSYGATALNQLDYEHHDREDEQNVDEPSDGVRAHQSERPENEEHDEDGPEHRASLPRRQSTAVPSRRSAGSMPPIMPDGTSVAPRV